MKHRSILTIGVITAVLLSSLYAIYSQVGDSERHQRLGSLLKSGEGAQGSELQDSAGQMVVDFLTNTPEWMSAESFVQAKGFQIDLTGFRAYQYKLDTEVLSILRCSSTVSVNGSIAEIVLVMDSSDRVSAWIVITNLPHETVHGGDPTFSTIPVLVWSNGLPVFYVHFYHLVGGIWVPYHYWWHDSSSHPNWYYSLYNYWWWYYEWYGHEWFFWYDWFFAWYYNVRFCYWSTYFPIPETSMIFGALLLVGGLVGAHLRRRCSH